MISERHNELGILLHALAESLDISDSQYEAAVKHYEAVGDWLNEQDSSIAPYQPAIYPQGSFRLGTMVKPVGGTDEYDIDLVCELKSLSKDLVTQRELKTLIGDRLKENERYGKMLEEGNRCWKLQYADSAHFHMDILPAIPDHEVASNIVEPILITDRELRVWQRSNPIGYAEWFKERMRAQFNVRRMALAKSYRASIEDVPEYKVKTPLQRAIQILKRHRDIMFMEDQEDGPISIIISTLAARAYNNESDLVEALQNIVDRMPSLIKRNQQGVAIIANPVNPLENFADKWQTCPQREAKFRQWIQQVRADLCTALQAGSLHDMLESLKPRFGDRIMNEVASKVFPARPASGSTTVSGAPHVSIHNPCKPWRA